MATLMTTQSDVKTHLGITTSADDVLLTKLQTSAEDFVANYCGRSFAGGTFIEDHHGYVKMILLQNFPVASVTSLKIDPERVFDADTIIDPDDYYLFNDRGVVESLYGPFTSSTKPGAVRITYVTAPGDVPGMITRATAELVGHWYRQVKTNVALSHVNQLSESDGSLQTSYPWGQAGGFSLPSGLFELLKEYRGPSL